MYIENARIDDVTIVPVSDVTIVPTSYWLELELKLELQEGYYTKTFKMVTPTKDIATLCDVVGVQSYGDLIGARIRVLIPDYGHIQIIGNRTYNKWVDLERFTLMFLSPEGLDILDAHKADNRKREEISMEIKDARIVTAFLKKKGDLYEFWLEIDLYDGIRYLASQLLLTHEALCAFFDVVEVRSGVSVRNTPIRVLADDEGKVLIVGNSMTNKWVDLKRFEITRVTGETVVPHTEDK